MAETSIILPFVDPDESSIDENQGFLSIVIDDFRNYFPDSGVYQEWYDLYIRAYIWPTNGPIKFETSFGDINGPMKYDPQYLNYNDSDYHQPPDGWVAPTNEMEYPVSKYEKSTNNLLSTLQYFPRSSENPLSTRIVTTSGRVGYIETVGPPLYRLRNNRERAIGHWGTVNGEQGYILEVQERIFYYGSSKSSVQYPISRIKNWYWIGHNLGNLTKTSLRELTADKTGTTICEITYETFYKLYQLDVNGSGNGDDDGVDVPCIIYAVDYSTNNPIPNAGFYYKGVLRGLTNTNGYIKIILKSGEQKIEFRARGYHSTLSDMISANDTIIIPAVTSTQTFKVRMMPIL